jgi:hypothetical protein
MLNVYLASPCSRAFVLGYLLHIACADVRVESGLAHVHARIRACVPYLSAMRLMGSPRPRTETKTRTEGLGTRTVESVNQSGLLTA